MVATQVGSKNEENRTKNSFSLLLSSSSEDEEEYEEKKVVEKVDKKPVRINSPETPKRYRVMYAIFFFWFLTFCYRNEQRETTVQIYFKNNVIKGFDNYRPKHRTIFRERAWSSTTTFHAKIGVKKKLLKQLVASSETCLLVGSDIDTDFTTSNVTPVNKGYIFTESEERSRYRDRFYRNKANGRLVFFYHGQQDLKRFFLMDIEIKRGHFEKMSFNDAYECRAFTEIPLSESDDVVKPSKTVHIVRVNNEKLVFKKLVKAHTDTKKDLLDVFVPFTDDSLMCLGYLSTGEHVFTPEEEKYVEQGFSKKHLNSNCLSDVAEKHVDFTNVCLKFGVTIYECSSDRLSKTKEMLQKEFDMRRVWDEDRARSRFDNRVAHYIVRPLNIPDDEFLELQKKFAERVLSKSKTFDVGNKFTFKLKDLGAKSIRFDGIKGDVESSIVEPSLDAEYFIAKTILSRYTAYNYLKHEGNDKVTSGMLKNMTVFGELREHVSFPDLRFNDFVTFSNPLKHKQHFNHDYNFSLFVPDAPIKHLRSGIFACRVCSSFSSFLEKRKCHGDYLCEGCFSYWRLAANVSTFLLDGNIVYKNLKKCRHGGDCKISKENHLITFNHL